jgi:hypothetical protein
MTRLLFVHGIAQEGRTPKELESEWLTALNIGLYRAGYKAADSAVVPFYGDELAKWTTSAGYNASIWGKSNEGHPDFLDRDLSAVPTNPDTLTRNGLSEARSSNIEFSKFAMEFAADALNQEPAVAAQAIALALASRALNPDDRDRDIQNWPPIIELTRILDKISPDLSSFFIAQFLKTVHCYLTNDNAFNSVNAIVTKSLAESKEPTIVIGHSLGSVVAYHVLHAHTDVEVPLFVTVGAPLAIAAVERRLKIPPRQPQCVKVWYNAFDRQDIVALNPLDKEHFPTDNVIENNSSIKNWTDNHHSISGYLCDSDVASKISTGL